MNIRGALCFLAVLILSSSLTYRKIVNSKDPEAVCLDGQQAFIYTTDKLEEGKSLLVYFMSIPSFSFCGGSSLSRTLENCLLVRQEITSFWTPTLEMNEGILSNNSFQSWAKVIIPYCDGSLFQGYRRNRTNYKNTDLFFRGNNIVKSNLVFLDQQFNLTKFQRIVVAGSGIGAIGALAWSRYFRDQIVLYRNTKDFKLILDSYPSSYSSYKTKNNQFQISTRYLLEVSTENAQHPSLLCSLRSKVNQQNRCFRFDEGYQYLNFPVLAIESQYDPSTISKILEIDCISSSGSLKDCSDSERRYIEAWRSQRLVSLFRFANFHDNSIWSISCSSSNFLRSIFDDDHYSIKQTKPRNAAENFVFYQRSISFDLYQWPTNEPCSGR